MVKRIVFVLLLFVGTWCDATFAWARGTSLVTPPTEMVGQIRVVDRTQNRVVLVPLLPPRFPHREDESDGAGAARGVLLDHEGR